MLDALGLVAIDPSLPFIRPVLALAQQRDPLLERAVQTEIDFWSKLDRLRLRAYQQASKPYVKALRASELSPDLKHEHERRVRIAEELLPQNPLDDATRWCCAGFGFQADAVDALVAFDVAYFRREPSKWVCLSLERITV